MLTGHIYICMYYLSGELVELLGKNTEEYGGGSQPSSHVSSIDVMPTHTCVFVHQCMRPYATSVCGLKLQVYEALSYEAASISFPPIPVYLCIRRSSLRPHTIVA